MEKKYINKDTIQIFIITGLLTLFSYIVLPFLAIYFTSKNLDVVQVGIILGTSSFASSVSGIFSPFFEKWFGTYKSIYLGVFIISICYLVFSIINNYYILLITTVLQGMGQGLINPLLKKTVALYNEGNENTAFRYRYIILCIAIIIGPIIGNIFSKYGVHNMLRIVSIGCILSCLALKRIDVVENKPQQTGYKKQNKYNINLSIVLFAILSILIFSVFSVFESVSPLAIQPYSTEPEKIFSMMVILNSILAILFQPIIIYLNDKLTLWFQIMSGSIFFFFAYFLFAYAKGELIYLILATIMFTFGEAILIPLLDVLVSKLAENQQLTALYAISEIKQLGFFVGPVLTTYIIKICNVNIMYLFVSTICILIMFIAFILLKLIRT